jgi:ABC-type lipoprotein export system ATPase subunit
MSAVEVRDLFRVHQTAEGDAAALQGLSLAVREREVVAVLGPSGSGKTTLLRILAGLDRPSAGSVRVFGDELGKLSARRLAGYRSETLGYADQHYSRALASELRARELVGLQLGLRGVPRREREARADELLERVGLADRREARPAELSGGEQQRIAVCAALAHRPRLFLADEPTGELDAANATVLYELIGELAREHGATTLIVSHDPESAAIADRIVRIRDGRVAGETSRDAGDADTIVVGRGGWLRLPEEYLLRVGIRSRATARVEDDRIVVASADAPLDEAPRERPDELARPDAPAHAGIVAEVRGLEKTYGSGATATHVLHGFSASFEAGRLVAVTGPSGSGKTTLLQLLAGLELPQAGQVLVLGTDLAALDRTGRARFRRERLALAGQQPGLVPFLSARENVELALALRGARQEQARERALEALDALGLTERAEQRVARLSTGERGRVAVARAIAARPALLLADEPTSRLDQANALAIGVTFARLAREWGLAIVCATHDPVVIEQADEELSLGRPTLAATSV